MLTALTRRLGVLKMLRSAPKCSEASGSIEKPGRVLLALTPHQQPKLLTRSWCLYEPRQPRQ